VNESFQNIRTVLDYIMLEILIIYNKLG